jgi:hypothetical protein
MNYRLLLGLGLVVLALFMGGGNSPLPRIVSVDYNSVLGLEKPDSATEKEVGDLKKFVTDQGDREKVAIFHNQMGKRLPKYENINTIQFENYYFDSAKESFEGKLANKYRDLGENIQRLIIGTLGENESYITKEEIEQLSKKMMAISWNLLN